MHDYIMCLLIMLVMLILNHVHVYEYRRTSCLNCILNNTWDPEYCKTCC